VTVLVEAIAFCTGWGIFALAAVLWWLNDRRRGRA
jgi:hypothetical protein